MREIEFRAYCKSLKRMMSFEHLKEATKGMVDVAKAEIQKRNMSFNKLAPYGLFLPLEDDDLIFMQYTGLEDNNGTKIFEGDIVEFETNITEANIKPYWKDVHERYFCVGNGTYFTRKDQALVKWNRSKGKFDLKVYNNKRYKRISELFTFRASGYEVIGNIYDNPELLEVSDE